MASKDFEGGHYKSQPQNGLRAFGRVYSAWSYGQAVRSSPLYHGMGILNLIFCLFFSGSDRISIFEEDCEHVSILGLNHAHHLKSRYPDLNAFLREGWERGFLESWDANDLLTLLHTWQTGDVSTVRDGGDLDACLSQIKAKGLIMPSKTDLSFPASVNF